MAKRKTALSYEKELRSMIENRTGQPCEVWLIPQVRVTAANMVIIDKIQEELLREDSLVNMIPGSMGQYKNEVNPLVAYYDKMQRTLMLQFEALGLNYKTAPSKVKEDTRRGSDPEKDGLARMLADAQMNMNEITEMT